MESTYTVYAHTTPSGKKYIGITCTGVTRRWRSGGAGYIRASHFYNAIKKYGWDNIKHEVLHDGLDKQTAKKIEIELIAYYQTQNREFGYNVTAGGEGVNGYHHTEESKAKIGATHLGNTYTLGYRHTEEAKRKMSLALMGNKRNLGKKRSDETRRKNSAASMGRSIGLKRSDESKRRMSIAQTGRSLGRKASDETRKKMSASLMGNTRNLGVKQSDETKAKIAAANEKPVIMIQNGEEIARYKSATAAAINIGVDISGIARACRGERKTAGGYQWRYALESESTARYATTLNLKGL